MKLSVRFAQRWASNNQHNHRKKLAMHTQPHISRNDFLFAGINGLLFGLMLPVIVGNGTTYEIPLALSAISFALLAVCGVGVGYILSRIKPFFFQLAKFGATGAANFAIDIGVLSLLINITEITRGIEFTLFKAIAFLTATVNGYLWNKYWSFGDRSSDDLGTEFSKFLTVSGIGFFLNVGIASLLNNIIGQHVSIDPRLWTTISAAIASVAVIMWNFLGYKFLVFKR